MKFNFSNKNPVEINNVSPNTIVSIISVSGVQGEIKDINVTVDLDHTFTSDLAISLIGPDGTKVLLVADEGGKHNDFIATTFDNDSSQSIINKSAPFTGNFKPEQSLEIFNELDPNGDWILEVEDSAFDDGGRLKSWVLEVEVPEKNKDIIFIENTSPLTINPGESNTVISVINVTGNADKSLKSIIVNLDITHTYDKDLTITLISPDNRRVKLVNRKGGDKNNFKSTTFSDDAEISIAKGKAPFKGDFKPQEKLSTLNGIRITGAWLLEVVDNEFEDGGVLNSWSVRIETENSPVPQPQSKFKLEVEFLGGLSSTQKAIFEDAVSRWQEIIIGGLPTEVVDGVEIRGLLIRAKGELIDGVGTTLGFARPIHLRPDSFIPITGEMTFDRADLDNMENDGSLLDVIIHEMGHVIGVGTIWKLLGLLENEGSVNPTFTGSRAQDEYEKLLKILTDNNVPVEGNNAGPGTADSHWRDSTFGAELMTGYINSGVKNSISRLTVASLEDMGYQVNMDAADDYVIPSPSLVARLAASPKRRECCLKHKRHPFIINGKVVSLEQKEVTFMEKASWSMSINTTSGISVGDSGVSELHASTIIPLVVESGKDTELKLQLGNVENIDMLTITSTIYDGKVSVAGGDDTMGAVGLSGPLILFGDMIKKFNGNLDVLKINNSSSAEASLKIIIGRKLFDV